MGSTGLSASADNSPSPKHSAELERVSAQGAMEERRKLARMLHDTVSQSLTGAYFYAQVITKKLQKNCPDESQEVAELADLIHRSVAELAAITQGLHASEDASADAPEKM